MISIIKNTFKIFFIQYIAFGIMCLFVLGLGGYFWVLPGDQNLLDAGFGDLTQVFRIMPWAVMPLVSTLSMRLFSVPSDNGTLDLLLTKPISVQSIVSGHFIGAFLVFLVLILSTISYPFSLAALITGPNDFDWGLYWSGLFGIILLGSLWLALGLLSSSLTKNPLVALILSLILNISSYFVPGVYGPNIIFMEFVSGLWPVGGGLYLISLTLVFLFLTRLSLEKIIYKKVHKFNKIKWFNVLNDFKIPAVIILLGILSLNYAPKWDVTTDQRFTLSKTTQDVLSGLNQTVFVDVLLDGELPLPFERLSQETEALLGRYGDYIELNINRLDPSESSIIQPSILQNLADFGVKANQITIKRNSRQESVLVYPYAMLTYNEKTVAVPLIKPTLREDLEESIATSIRYLEYAFTDALIQLSHVALFLAQLVLERACVGVHERVGTSAGCGPPRF